MIDVETSNLIIQYIYCEYDLPIDVYCKLIAQPLKQNQKEILELWLEKLYSGILKRSEVILPDKLTLVEQLILQRWSIDLGQYDFSLHLFEQINLHLSELHQDIQDWVLFFAGKAKQHKGKLKEALYFYDQLSERSKNETLMLYLTLEKAYLFYQNGEFQNSIQMMEKFGKTTKDNDKGVQGKILCNYGILLYCYGRLNEAQSIFLKLITELPTVIVYRHRAMFYLFQLYVETNEIKKADKLVDEAKSVFYDKLSEYRFSFCRSWIMWLNLKGSQQEADHIIKEAEKELVPKSNWAHNINFWADCYMLSRQDILRYSRQSKIRQDQYSRYYLWLKQIYRRNIFISKSQKLKILKIMIPYFQQEMLCMDLLLAEALMMGLQSEKPSVDWIQKVHSLGHSYLFNIFTQSDVHKSIFVFWKNSQLIYCSNGEIVDLGKDRNSLLLLSLIASGEANPKTYSHQVFGDKELDFHSFKKLSVALYRINKKLNSDMIKVQKDNIVLNSDYIIVELTSSGV